MVLPAEGNEEDSGLDKIHVLIPAHNTGKRIGAVLRGVVSQGLDCLVVDDGATDDTAEQARAAGAEVLSLPARSGKGTAVRSGLEVLRRRGSCDWILMMDGDGQHLPSEIPKFLEHIGPRFDMLVGDRMSESRSIPPSRRWTNQIGTAFVRIMTGQPVSDVPCGFRAVRASLLFSLPLRSKGFSIDVEMIIKALGRGARWRSIPVSAVYNGQQSHYRPVLDTWLIVLSALRYVE
jgi:glycosyltransferase involved in cell wall biosynthesis